MSIAPVATVSGWTISWLSSAKRSSSSARVSCGPIPRRRAAASMLSTVARSSSIWRESSPMRSLVPAAFASTMCSARSIVSRTSRRRSESGGRPALSSRSAVRRSSSATARLSASRRSAPEAAASSFSRRLAPKRGSASASAAVRSSVAPSPRPPPPAEGFGFSAAALSP